MRRGGKTGGREGGRKGKKEGGTYLVVGGRAFQNLVGKGKKHLCEGRVMRREGGREGGTLKKSRQSLAIFSLSLVEAVECSTA